MLKKSGCENSAEVKISEKFLQIMKKLRRERQKIEQFQRVSKTIPKEWKSIVEFFGYGSTEDHGLILKWYLKA